MADNKNHSPLGTLLDAIKDSNFAQFKAFAKTEHIGLFSQEELAYLFQSLLPDSPFFFRKKRRVRMQMFEYLLSNHTIKESLNRYDDKGNSVLHIAVKLGYEGLVDLLINNGVEFAIENNNKETPLQIAAKYNRKVIYEKLLNHHSKTQKKYKGFEGYSVGHIEQAKNQHIKNLKRKQLTLGILGAILTIACPVGSILAFYQLPLLGIVLSSLLPVVGPIIGLAGALIIGGLLFWSMYHKSSLKYGQPAQFVAELNATNAKLDLLESKLHHLNEQAKDLLKSPNPKNLQQLRDERLVVIKELETLYSKVKPVQSRTEANHSDWATFSDESRTGLLTFGTFLCSFSGVIGILGVGLGFSGVALSIPIVGWAALGVALLVGIGVAVWAFHSKFKPTLEKLGEQRKELHEKQVQLCERKLKFENELKPLPELITAPSRKKSLSLGSDPSQRWIIKKQADAGKDSYVAGRNKFLRFQIPQKPPTDVITESNKSNVQP